MIRGRLLIRFMMTRVGKVERIFMISTIFEARREMAVDLIFLCK